MSGARRFLHTLGSITAGVASMAIAYCVWRFALWPLLDGFLGPGEQAGVVMRRIGIAASLTLGYWLFVRYAQKREALELAFRPIPFVLGAASGAMLIGITISALFVAGHYQVIAFRDLAPAIGVAVFIFGAAVLEELFFRGLVFAAVERQIGTVRALALQSVFFAAAHFFNDDVRLVTMLNVTLIGALWTAIFVLTRNVWVISLHHAAWNFLIYASGAPLSGIVTWRDSAPIEITYDGPLYLTGGAFGPEDSVITTVVAALGLAVLLWWLNRTGGFHPRTHDMEGSPPSGIAASKPTTFAFTSGVGSLRGGARHGCSSLRSRQRTRDAGGKAMDFHFSGQPDFVEVTDYGRPELRDFNRFFDLLRAFGSWEPGRNLLIDDTQLDASRMSAKDVRQAAWVTEKRRDVFGEGNVAIFAPDDLEFGINRMWLGRVESSIDANVTICRTRESGLAWLAAQR